MMHGRSPRQGKRHPQACHTVATLQRTRLRRAQRHSRRDGYNGYVMQGYGRDPARSPVGARPVASAGVARPVQRGWTDRAFVPHAAKGEPKPIGLQHTRGGLLMTETVTIDRVGGSQATFEPHHVLRVRRVMAPGFTSAAHVTEIDLSDPLLVIRSGNAIDMVVDKLRPAAHLVEFTAADRSPVFVNATKVGDVQPCPRKDAGGARTIFAVGGLRQAVCQAPEVVASEIAKAIA